MPPNYFFRSRWLNSVELVGIEPTWISCLQGRRPPLAVPNPILLHFLRQRGGNVPNLGFHILDFQLLTWFIFPLAYADIFLSSSTRVRKHTLRNLPNEFLLSDSDCFYSAKKRNRQFHPHLPPKVENEFSFLKKHFHNGTSRARTYDPLVNSQLLYLLSYGPKYKTSLL